MRWLGSAGWSVSLYLLLSMQRQVLEFLRIFSVKLLHLGFQNGVLKCIKVALVPECRVRLWQSSTISFAKWSWVSSIVLFSSSEKLLQFPKRPWHRMMSCWPINCPRLLTSWFFFPRCNSFLVPACDVSCDWRMMSKSAVGSSLQGSGWGSFLTLEFLLLPWGVCFKFVRKRLIHARIRINVFNLQWRVISITVTGVLPDKANLGVVKCRKFLSGLSLYCYDSTTALSAVCNNSIFAANLSCRIGSSLLSFYSECIFKLTLCSFFLLSRNENCNFQWFRDVLMSCLERHEDPMRWAVPPKFLSEFFWLTYAGSIFGWVEVRWNEEESTFVVVDHVHSSSGIVFGVTGASLFFAK